MARRGGSPSSPPRTRGSRSTHETTAAEQKRLRRIEALESLREGLNLESLPVRIECFDISNLQGRDIVASMTVFVDAQPKKAHYRSFTVRGLEGQDDFASMAQVIARRFARLRDSAVAGRYDESFAAVPNLVVIDGGKGQLAAALEAIQATYELPARRGDRAREARRRRCSSRAGRSRSCSTGTIPGCSSCSAFATRPTGSPSRFHRQKRDTRAFASIFDTLDGIGPSRAGAILRHFGSADRFLAASQEELEAVPGLPAKTARSVFGQLHRTGGPGT